MVIRKQREEKQENRTELKKNAKKESGRKLQDETKQNILWAVTNVASGNTDDTMYVISQGGIEYFLEFCNDPCEDVFSQALWGLSNLAGESASIRDRLLDLNTLHITLTIYHTYKYKLKLETKRTIAWMINNLCRYKPPVNYFQVKDSVPYLLESLGTETDKEIVVENLWTCAYISDTGDEAIQGFVQCGILTKVANVVLTQVDNIVLLTPALRTLSNIVSGNDDATDYIISLNVVPTIVALLSHAKIAVRKEVCFFLSNVAAGTPPHIDYIYKFPSLLSKVKGVILNDDATIRVEALWVLSNSMMGGSKDHKISLIKAEVFYEILVSNLSILTSKGVRVLLEGLRELLNFSYEEHINTTEVNKIVNLLSQPGGVKDAMIKIIDNIPEVLALLQEILETVGDYREDVLGETLDRKMNGLSLYDHRIED